MTERADCRVCGTECSVNANGTIRHHQGKKPEHYAGPDSKKCLGAGEFPAGAAEERADASGQPVYRCKVPAAEGCGKTVQLTSNGRARSHLNDQDPAVPCPGGSDWPVTVWPDGRVGEVLPSADELRFAEGHAGEFDPTADPRDWLAAAQMTVGIDPSGPGAVVIADDGRTLEQQAEIDRRREAGAAGELERLQNAVLGYDPRDPEGPGVTTMEELNRELKAEEELTVCLSCPDTKGRKDHSGCVGRATEEAPDKTVVWHRPDTRTTAYSDGSVTAGEVFDVTHRLVDESGVEWVHPGEAADCRLPDCCTHPGGFTWVDDDNGHEGSFCAACGAEEPEPSVPEPEPTPEPSPVCRLDDIQVGTLFRRHTIKNPKMAALVYRVQTVTDFCISATVVSSGAHAGRTGELTNLQEEVTCTDLDGNPRPRRSPTPSTRPEPAPAAPAPSSTTSPTARGTGRSSRPSTTASAPPPPASGTARSGPGTTSGPTAPAASPTPSASKRRTDVADAFSTPKQAVKEADKYDGYGRYKLLHPKTGKKVNWTRATTFCKSIQDTFALSQWAQRMVLKGAARRSDIVDAAGTLDVKADKDRLNGLVEEAKKAAGDKVAANRGTAVHKYTEDRDRVLAGLATEVAQIPERHLPTVDAYEALLQEFGLEPVPGLIEFTTAVLQYEIAGTSDRVYRVTKNMTFKLHGRMVSLYAGEYVIGDVKTGADLSYGWMEIAIQLAIYAQGLNANGYWSWDDRQWHIPHTLEDVNVRLQVRTDVAIVPHLPVDRKEGAPLATLFAVDTDTGWANAVLCAQVRASRKESGLATPLKVAYLDLGEPQVTPQKRHSVPSQPSAAEAPDATVTALPPVRESTLEEKAQAVINQAQASSVWNEAKGTPGMTRARLTELTEIMRRKLESHVEKAS